MSAMRFAIDGTIKISKTVKYDVVIVGAGIAGLYTALNIDSKFTCCVLAKETIDMSNSWLAQGGIAAAISKDDDPKLHFDDTIIAGAGLCDENAVRVLVDEGPSDILNLVSLHVPFDLNKSGQLAITREGGHHKNRIVHAGGDATGREAVKSLAYTASIKDNITFHDNSLFVDIITDTSGAVSGIIVKTLDGEYVEIASKNVVIATGGIGQVYKVSTNPDVATGDGIAAAVRAGAMLQNIEFIQFHPTGLWSSGPENRAFLISEAVRGEGGLLKNRFGERFMTDKHELGELAPRDIVARGIVRDMERTGDNHVFVDITHKDEDFLSHRFPTIYNECLKRGINISKDMIPVCPVQHYLIGGIKTDLDARTTVPGLFACGEAASTGVHGANRLASNSMLECLVFGRRAAFKINERLYADSAPAEAVIPECPVRKKIDFDYNELKGKVQQIMNDYGHVIRNKNGLEFAIGEIKSILGKLESSFDDSKEYIELLNICTIASAILNAALARKDSVGAHFRED